MSEKSHPEILSPIEPIQRSRSCNKGSNKPTSESFYRPVISTANSFFPSNEDPQKCDKQSEQEREQMLALISTHQKELEFLNTIIPHFLDTNELMKIKQKSVYDKETAAWVLPNFVVQQKKTIFLNIQRSQVKEIIGNEMKKRKIVLKTSQPTEENEIEIEQKYIERRECREMSECRPGTSSGIKRVKNRSVKNCKNVEKIKFRY